MRVFGKAGLVHTHIDGGVFWACLVSGCRAHRAYGTKVNADTRHAAEEGLNNHLWREHRIRRKLPAQFPAVYVERMRRD